MLLVSCLLFALPGKAQVVTWFRDIDSDGWGDPSVSTTATSQPTGYVLNNSDCNDANSNSSAWVSMGSSGFSQYAASYTSIILDASGIPYVAYNDNTTKGSVQKYDGGEWTYVGSQHFTSGQAEYVSLAINNSGSLYMAYRDNGYKASVMRYNGSSWVNVGSAQFTLGGATYTSLVLDASSTPYVAYRDDYYLYPNKATVMKYNGSSWVTVGSPGFSAGTVTYTSLAIDGSGTLYLAFSDAANSNKATVMKYNGSSWVLVGSAGFSAGTATYVSLALDPSGTPFVAYNDGGNSNKATVRKYNGSTWVTVGPAGFSAGAANDVSLVVDSAKTPYVVYSDAANSNKATVMKYNGSSWVNVISAGITPSSATFTDIALSKYGVPYIAYRDGSNKSSAMNLERVVNYPTIPVVSATPSVMCSSGTMTLSLTGTLNDATSWKWYSGSCGGTYIGAGTSLTTTLTATTTYFVRGENSCAASHGSCGFVTATLKTPTPWYLDSDGDGWGNPSVTTTACSAPSSSYLANSIDCNDAVFTNTQYYALSSAAINSNNNSWSSIAIDRNTNTPYIAFYESFNRGSVMKYSSGSWSYVGSALFTSGATQYNSLAIDASGTPYMAYQDNWTGASVKKYNGSTWVDVGSNNFSAAGATYISLAIDPAGTPFVAYSDAYYMYSNKATVMKFNGSSWVTVGSPGLTAGVANYTSLAVDGGGTPYLAYSDAANSDRVSVMRYNGSSWVQVGSAGFSAGAASFVSLALDDVGTPYVVYRDAGNSNKATVMKYNGSSWVNVGSAGVTSGAASYTSIALDGSNNPYIVYSDGANSNKATVMKYNGSSWSVFGNAGYSAGAASYTTLAIDVYGIPITAFQDAGSSSRIFGMKAGPLTSAPTTPSVSVSINPVGCGSPTVLSATGTLNGAANWYWYSGSCGGTFVGVGSSFTVSPTSATTYYARGDGGCLTTPGFCNSVAVSVTAGAPVVAAITGPDEVCEDGTITLSCITPGGTWSSSNTSKATVNSSGVVTGVSNGGGTSILYTVTNACGTTTRTHGISVLNGAGPITGSMNICVGGTTDLDGSGSGTWTSSNTSVATIISGSGDATGVSAGTSNITYTRSSSGCAVTGVITVNSSPGAITGPGVLCMGYTISLGSSPGGGTWTSSNTSNATVGAATGIVSSVSTGSTTITYTLPTGCFATHVVDVENNPGAITGTRVACAGSTTTLTSSGIGSWSSSNTSVATVNSTGEVTGVTGGTAIITYSLTSTGCFAVATVTINPLSTIGGSTLLCMGSTTTLTNSISGGTWASSNLARATIGSSSGLVTPVSTGTATISYTLPTGCRTTTVITINSAPSLASVTNSGPICAGATLTLTSSGPSNVAGYSWSGPVAVTSSTSAVATVPSATTAASGTYTVTVNNGAGAGCTASYTTAATVNAKPIASPTNNGPKCGASATVTLTATPAGGASVFAWSGPNLSSTTAQNPTATPTVTSTYSLTVTNGTASPGCSPSTVYTTTVTVNSLPTAAPTNNGPLCDGATAILTANPGGSTNRYTWSGPNLSSTTVQNPTATPTVTSVYSLTVSYNTGLPGCSPSTVYTTTVSVTPGSRWLGIISNDWFTSGNWCGGIPGTSTAVTIPTGTTYYPLITTGTASANNLTIQNSASVTVTGGTLRISGTISNSGTFTAAAGGIIEMNGTVAQVIPASTFTGDTISNLTINNSAGVTLSGSLAVKGILKATAGAFATGGYLTLLSTAAQTALVDGSGAGTVTGSVTMQRYLQQGYGYKYISSPFTSANVSGLSAFIDLGASFPRLYAYDENVNTAGWVNYTLGSNILFPMKGYSANFGTSTSPVTYSLAGTVTNGAVSATLYNNNRTYTLGFNLVGNPYPSPIDWTASSGWTKTNIDNAIYYFNASDTNQYTGTYSSYISGISSDGVANNIIPAMQGFFVHVSNGSYPVTGTLATNNNVRVNSLTPYYHKVTADPPLLRLDAAFGANAAQPDPTVIYFDDQANGSFNNNIDALKLMNTSVSVPSLYSFSGDAGRLSIQALKMLPDSTSVVPLGITTETDDRVIFNARDIVNVPADVHIYFYDTKTNKRQDLMQEPQYSVNLEKGKHENRFFLMFTKKDIKDLPVVGGELNAYASGQSLFVYLLGGTGSLRLTNILGQVIAEEELSGNGYHEIKLQVSPGIYFATLHSGMGKQSKKVFIGN